MKRLLLFLIRFYRRYISPMHAPCCRFTPTCSTYALQAIEKYGAVYFAAIGGAGALYGNAVKKSELVAFPDLLSEAVYRFTVEDFPCVVAIDGKGGNIYKR